MFDFSFAELLVVMLVALLVIGPKELPGVLRTVGRIVGTLRRQAQLFWQEVEQMDPISEKGDADGMRKIPPSQEPPHRIIGDDGKEYPAYDVQDLHK